MNTSISVTTSTLPANIEDLSKFVLVGREQLVAVRAAIRAIDKVGVAQEVRKQKLKEGQEIGEAVLDAEVRIGELMRDVPKASGGDHGNQYTGGKVNTDDKFATSKTKLLADMGFTPMQGSRFETLAAHPEIVAQAKAEAREKDEIVTRSLVLNRVKDKQREEHRQEKMARKAFSLDSVMPSDMCWLFNGDIRDGLPCIKSESVDCIITDPPYPAEYIPLYGDLSRLAARVLKPNGSLVVMCGQSYLPEVIRQLCTSMKYHWTMAYMTPGGQSPQLFTKKVNTFWKPLLWFTKGEYKGDWMGDVLKSPVNDNDKRFHEWGQSYGGMVDIVTRFTDPDQVILDPFLGGGTTGLAAVTNGRRFIGSDIVQKNIDTARERIAEGYANARSQE